MKLRSITAGLGSAAIVGGIAACGHFVTYAEHDLPDAEIASVACYSRYYFVYIESCRIQAIDGLRPELSEMFGNTSKMLPGSHWVEVAFESYFGDGGGVTDVCAFDIELRPGAAYRIQAHSLKTAIGHLAKHGHQGFYGGSIELAMEAPAHAQEIRQIPVTCSFAGGSMCRKDADCVPHPDIRCFPQEGFLFGACRFIDAR
ncbi:MAG: hypothetical protein HYU78_11980 [Rhodocyclales bacterium]|nr:hypothetical protein [Rhodocyclales bacterium]